MKLQWKYDSSGSFARNIKDIHWWVVNQILFDSSNVSRENKLFKNMRLSVRIISWRVENTGENINSKLGTNYQM